MSNAALHRTSVRWALHDLLFWLQWAIIVTLAIPADDSPECVGIVETRILAPEGRGSAYSYSPRSDEVIASDPRGSTLRTGYCDRKIDEDRLSEIEI